MASPLYVPAEQECISAHEVRALLANLRSNNDCSLNEPPMKNNDIRLGKFNSEAKEFNAGT